jgi:hypothetical protein
MYKKIIGNILVIGGMGALVFLYIGYYRPKQLGLQDALKKTKK